MQLADVIDAGTAGGIHLDDVDMAVFGDRDAVLAYAARADRRAASSVGADAVQRAGDNARGRGLADPAHAGKHEGMGDAPGAEGVGQGAHHRLLPDQLLEGRAGRYLRASTR